MNNTVKILLVAAGGFALYYFFLRKKDGMSSFSGGEYNEVAGYGPNTCKSPYKVVQGSCVLPKDFKGAAIVASKPNTTTSPISSAIIKRAF